MIHLIKLAVGVRDIAHLAAIQKLRAAADPPLRHQTRSTPKRAAELIAGGSIYWVIAGLLQARQPVRDVVAGEGLSGLAVPDSGRRAGGYRHRYGH
jgi:hypothetical protein